VAASDDQRYVGPLGRGPGQQACDLLGRDATLVVLAVNEPDIGEPGAIHIFTLLVGDDVSPAVGGTAVLRCSLPPVEIAIPHSTEKFEAELFETDAR